jgi:hypothetical protein
MASLYEYTLDYDGLLEIYRLGIRPFSARSATFSIQTVKLYRMPPRPAQGKGRESSERGSPKSGRGKAQPDADADSGPPEYTALILELLNESQAKIAAALQKRQDDVLSRINQCDVALAYGNKKRR